MSGFIGILGTTRGEYYWTEFHRGPNTEYFQTTDGYQLQKGTYLDDYPWKTDHPIDSMDCVGFDGYRLELLSLECNTTHLAVCQIGK